MAVGKIIPIPMPESATKAAMSQPEDTWGIAVSPTVQRASAIRTIVLYDSLDLILPYMREINPAESAGAEINRLI